MSGLKSCTLYILGLEPTLISSVTYTKCNCGENVISYCGLTYQRGYSERSQRPKESSKVIYLRICMRYLERAIQQEKGI